MLASKLPALFRMSAAKYLFPSVSTTRSGVANRSLKRRFRTILVLAADVGAAALSLKLALYLRLEPQHAEGVLASFPPAIPLFALFAAAIFLALGTYRRTWRFASSNDMLILVPVCGLTIGLYYIALVAIGQAEWMPRSTPFIQWLVLLALLAGMRMGRRLIGDFLRGAVRPPAPCLPVTDQSRPTLIAGPAEQVDLLLRQLEHPGKRSFRPVGILDHRGALSAIRVRGVPVVGCESELKEIVERLEARGMRPKCLLYADRMERLRSPAMVRLVTDAQALGLDVGCLQQPVGYDPSPGSSPDFRYLNPTDLLGRPQTSLAIDPVARAISGRCVLVTGAGGTIGRELARQIASLGPSKLLLLDSNEFNLYDVDIELGENHPSVPRVPLLCSIRQRAQLMRVFRDHRPQLVFHAAALKHVPLVEAHPSAGIQTNVLGTRNVADAVRRYGALAMVQVSTDKAVNPVGFMGVTKRLGELYCQALDVAEQDSPNAPRFMTVRFGNVLGSSGSLIPLFQRQLSRGGPLTVTHPEIERFFMTVHEAVQLVLHGAARGLQQGSKRGRIFVLDMGEPIRVMEIARRMIRLAGLEPDADVKIDIVGLRPGEKLFEELFDEEEERLPAAMSGIMEAESRPLPLPLLNEVFDAMGKASARGDDAACREMARELLRATRREQQAIISFGPRQAALVPQLSAALN